MDYYGKIGLNNTIRANLISMFLIIIVYATIWPIMNILSFLIQHTLSFLINYSVNDTDEHWKNLLTQLEKYNGITGSAHRLD